MDCRVPPRVTYWTGIWDPTREALSREVDLLRRLGTRTAPVVSFSSGQRSALTRRDGVVRLSAHRWILLRGLAALIERTGDVTHVLGPMESWHLLRALGRRPLVFTVAIAGAPLPPALYRKVTLFATETEPLAAGLRSAGIPEERIRVVYPGVDLDRFVPGPPPTGRFRVVFASSPANAEDFEVRGIPLMVEAARLCPEIDIVLLWRQWGDRSAARHALAELRPPANLLVEHRDAADIVSVFHQAHATIWMAAPGHGKSCPNSVVEGLACGRPAIVSPSCEIAELITRHGAGLAPARDPVAVAAALRTLAGGGMRWQTAARELAEQHFSLAGFTGAYRSLYDEVIAERGAPLAGLERASARGPGA